MGVWKDGRTHFFVCDVWDFQTAVAERKNATWDEVRMIPVGLREEGWRLNKRGGKWEAQCPECARYSGYRMDLEGLDD